MSVNSHLTSLASTLVLDDVEELSISTSIKTLSSRLNLYFDSMVTGHFQFGSSTRGTILPRKVDKYSDIDYMVVFKTSDGQKKPQTYLDRLRHFVELKYSRSEICQSHPTIVLSLNHINFELVPAIYYSGYQIPSPASSWLEWTTTDPVATNQLLQAHNKNNNYQIKPLVRLVKYWNTLNDYPFTSFSLEQYIVSRPFFQCSLLKDYFYEFWSGFNCSYNDAQYKKNIVNSAKNHAIKAKEYENNNMPMNAELEIRKIVP
ncbi:nucleotidyltransferase [Fortiea sp. LEGE XX443]|uniref:SMODS domain-containing nucleotidyltransferase n=1 Tax=Fortiea sp. LEGE XX443 TaxID=1828611 RepID=UPI0018805E20|nr:nucleotidyltransferase [Fortiea sp. LEGE XX443]MBE9006661.1 nucleotidyltransferase [Fortiea sp. LEGE XX443]